MSLSVERTTTSCAAVPAGLSSAEAARRRVEFGPNAVVEERAHPLKQVARHFWAPVPWMLEATITLQIVIGERLEALMIATLLILNVALDVFQESRANAALALLKQHLSLKVRVRRDGVWTEAPAADLVPGDIVQVSLGSVVPADLKIMSGSLLLDQSMLTGESVPAETEAGKIAYAGSLVRRGEAVAGVVATGTRTYFGHTAELVRVAHVESAEQKAVLGIVRNLTVVNFTIVVGMVAYARVIGMGVPQIIPLVLTALLSAVPVALPATFTLAAALGAKALALKGVLLTRLSALHEAAMIDVLCADKTGTLTANELAVSRVRAVRPGYNEADVLGFAALASSAEGQDPIDSAIRSMLTRCTDARHTLPIVVRFTPFDPAAKMAEATAIDQGRTIRIVKGAPAVIGTVAPIAAPIVAEVDAFARAGYRTLAVAVGPPDAPEVIGLIAFSDPPRAELGDATDRAALPRRAPNHGHRRRCRYCRDRCSRDRIGRTCMPARKHPRERRSRRFFRLCRRISRAEIPSCQGVSAAWSRRRHVRRWDQRCAGPAPGSDGDRCFDGNGCGQSRRGNRADRSGLGRDRYLHQGGAVRFPTGPNIRAHHSRQQMRDAHRDERRASHHAPCGADAALAGTVDAHG